MCGRDLIYFLILINDKISCCFLCGSVQQMAPSVMTGASRRITNREEGSCVKGPAPILTVNRLFYRFMGP